MAISLQSYNEILGKLIRKMIADTPVNDLNTGSVLLSLLEAVAAQDFENNVSILSVLETLNIDALKNLDLDVRAADYGISRKTSSNATGFVKISDSSITKRSTTLYAVKPAPIAGDNRIFVNNADNWGTLNVITGKRSGKLYIGRGTQQFEGPIDYYDVIDNGSFYEIKLGTSELSTQSLQKDHLSSDAVVDGQGTVDRLISAGTIVKILSNNLTPEIKYSILRDAIIPAGEDSISGVQIVAAESGAASNAGLNTITNFDNLPFSTATVTNTSVLLDGRDTESDEDLRERIKNYSSTLARGTRAAILSAIVGVSDSTDSKQVSSAVIQESVEYGEPSIVYVDDGSGFQPTTQGQSVDTLLASANGGEQFLQLSNYPVPRPQVVNQVSGPVELSDGMRLVVSVDGEEQEIVFSAASFNNIASATLIEVSTAINDQANTYNYNFRSRLVLDSTRILIYSTKFDAEFIQVAAEIPGSVVNANIALSFPTTRASYISLYKNNTLLRAQETSATLTTLQSPWTSLNTSGTLILSVDGTPAQTAYFSTADFGGSPMSSVSPAQWAAAMNLKFAGITAGATSNGKIQIISNKSGNLSSLEVVGGTYVDDWFSGVNTISTGSSSDFTLNRQTGNLKLSSPASTGDSITAGNLDAKGYITTAPTNTGTYDLTADGVGRPSEMVVVADGLDVAARSDIVRPIGTGFKIVTTGLDAGVMRVVCQSASTFQNAQVNDFLYITYKALESIETIAEPKWFREANSGLFKIIAKGSHTIAGTDTYVDVVNVGAVEEPATSWYFLSSDLDIQVFKSDAYPQIWKASYVSDTVPVTLKQMTDSFENDLLNVKGSLFKTNMDKLTSSTENNGAIAVPVSVGKLSFIVDTAQGSQLGNQSHIATRITSSDMLTWFKRGAYAQDNYVNKTTTSTLLPDRSRYFDISGVLSSSTAPETDPQYAENLTSTVFDSATISPDDVVNITSGSNKSLFRNVTDILGGNEIGTRKSTPYTTFDYLLGDSVELLKPLTFSSDDSIVFVMDGDAVSKTINVNFWRTGRVNSNISPTNSSFSADDADNESGVDFSSPTVWSTSSPIFTNFNDYALWFRSRNWYRSGGSLSSDGTLIIRAKEYGPIGDSHRFSIDYPSSENQDARISHSNNPEYTTSTYYFGSGNKRATNIGAGTLFSVSEIQTITTTSEGAGAAQVKSGSYFRLPNLGSGVVFWYDVNNGGTAQPSISPAPDRYVEINTINSGDTAAQVAQKTQVAIDNDDDFSATVDGDVISYFNNFNGLPAGSFIQYNISFVKNSNTNLFRYTFIGGVNLASVVQNDVLSVSSDSVANDNNSGTFSIISVNSDNKYVDVYNPNGSPTAVGRVDKVQVSNIVAAGTSMTQNITVTAGSGITTGGYFKLYDQTGFVVFWYDLTGSTPAPSVSGALRYVKISGLTSGSTAAAVASATSSAVDSDLQFVGTYTSGSMFTVTNAFVGPVQDGANGSGTGFTFLKTNSGNPIGGKYFKLYDDLTATVAVWFNVNGDSLPPHGCSRAIQVLLDPTDSANTVASKIALTIGSDAAFNATSSTSNVYISSQSNGARGTAADGASPYSSGFTVSVTQTGQNDTNDASTSTSGVVIYPLVGTDVASIASVVNSSATITAAVVGSTSANINKATKDELLPVAYEHDPDPLNGKNNYVSMYDGFSFIRVFSNSNPNFALKTSLLLQGEEPAIYDMSSCPNPETTDVGEFFKLVPKTITNVKHHLTHKALSQLPIVANIDIAGAFRKLQVKSKKLGTLGAVEIVGGRANKGELEIISSAGSTVNDAEDKNYLTLTTQAYPNTLNKGDVVKIYNTLPAKRKFNPDSSVSVEVRNDTLGNVSYMISSRDFNYSPYTKWTIADVSGSYPGVTAGTVWRWTHNEAGSKAVISGKVQTYNISSITRTSGTAYVNVSSSHTLLAGQKIVISGIVDVPSFNGEWVVLNPSTNTFEFASSGSDTSSTGGKITSIETQTTTVKAYNNSSILITSRLRPYDFYAGNSSLPFKTSLTVDSVPSQGDFFLITGPEFYSPGTTSVVAVWFSVDGNNTAPTGAAYTSSSIKIKVSITSSDSINTIVNKLSIALNADTDFAKYMKSDLEPGTDLSVVEPGDIVNVWPSALDTDLKANWPMSNQSQTKYSTAVFESNSTAVSGFPVLAVDPNNRYMDILNPKGKTMSTPTYTGETGNMSISPSIATRFRLKHSSIINIDIIVQSNVATATSSSRPHNLSIGDTVVVSDATNTSLNGTRTVTATPSPFEFKFSITLTDGNYSAICIKSGETATRYKISKLGFKNLMRIEKTQGDSPKFADCGVAVDDFIEISGNSFNANNRGRFRILAINNDALIVENSSGVEELNTYKVLNYMKLEAAWTVGSNQVTGEQGTFRNVTVGSWVKSVDDDDSHFAQVLSLSPSTPSLATSVTLGQNYSGSSGKSQGVVCNFEIDVDQGSELINVEDIKIYECDSAVIGDYLVVDTITNSNWFNILNSGKRVTTDWGTDNASKRQYVTVKNVGGISQLDVNLGTSLSGIYLLENEKSLYETIRVVENTAISRFNFDQRIIYATPNDRYYKMSSDYGTTISSMGKMGFSLSSATGIDGYLYYVGLMRTVQRVIDGYEPDIATYPGRRAVGSTIEVLPPLIKKVAIVLKVATKDGVNLNDVTNDIKSTIITYVASLGVGEDVVLSEVIRRVKNITGVDAVTFTNPAPSEERISVNDNEKALTSPDLISLS